MSVSHFALAKISRNLDHAAQPKWYQIGAEHMIRRLGAIRKFLHVARAACRNEKFAKKVGEKLSKCEFMCLSVTYV